MNLAPLFEPVGIGGLALKNRFVMPAMQRQLTRGGVPGEEMVEYYRARAAGGMALLIGEGIAINHPSATQYLKYALFHAQARAGAAGRARRRLGNVRPAVPRGGCAPERRRQRTLPCARSVARSASSRSRFTPKS